MFVTVLGVLFGFFSLLLVVVRTAENEVVLGGYGALKVNGNVTIR